jgi:histidine triad (HIT) family protein
MSAHCTFCAIVERRSPSEGVYETDDVYVFMDALPMTPGHCLLVPKRHVDDLYSLPAGEGEPLLAAASVMATRLVRRLGAKGVNVLNNNGYAADQSQFHLHFHVIPRYGDDRLLHPWERRFGHWPEIRDVATRLRAD